MRASEILHEGRSQPVIVVDVQPEYSGQNDGAENPVFPEIINFVALKQTGPVLMFVNAEDQGFSGDTLQDIQKYWNDTVTEEAEEYWDDEGEYHYTEPKSPINWNRFTVVDKGYGYFRGFMDNNVSAAAIIRLIRHLYQHKLNDSRELEPEVLQQLMAEEFQPWMLEEPFSINWTSVAQLKRFSGAYIVGGGRNECLREVELLMNAFNIRYRRIDHLVYG